MIEPEGDIFTYAQVIVADEGTCLTPEIRLRFENAIQKQPAVATGQISTRRINGRDGITGYVGIAAFGPGGTATRAVMHIPVQCLDWQITITQASEPEKTQENLSSGQKPDFIVGALESSVQELAARAAADTFSLRERTQPQQQPTSTAAIPQSSPIPAAETSVADRVKGASAPPSPAEANSDPGNGIGHGIAMSDLRPGMVTFSDPVGLRATLAKLRKGVQVQRLTARARCARPSRS